MKQINVAGLQNQIPLKYTKFRKWPDLKISYIKVEKNEGYKLKNPEKGG